MIPRPALSRAGVFDCGAATDTGLLRDSNEDRHWIDPERGIFLVVDGIGGHAAGDLAAEIAVREIQQTFVGQASASQPEHLIRSAITRANNRIYELARQQDAARGMACVLTLALVTDDELILGHVGDSRLYLVWQGAIRKLTADHSPVGEQEDAGELSEREAMRHPRRNQVFRDVGSQPHSPADPGFIDIRRCRFRPDAAILLCSDGLTDQLTAAQIREIITTYSASTEGSAGRVARALVEAANEAGGADNTTALFIAGPRFGAPRETTRLRLPITKPATPHAVRRRFLTGGLAFLACGLLLGMLVWAVLARHWIKL
jgi:PPM family protein phosphatase